MVEKRLTGLKVAIVATDDFELVELTEPRQALEAAGAITMVIAPHEGEIQGLDHDERSERIKVDLTLEVADPRDFDALLLPGGALNADNLRMNDKARRFVEAMNAAHKPLAIICHAPWLLVSDDLVHDRSLTSYYTIQDDIKNAGGNWLDREVVIDDNWVTSRSPEDIPAFNREMIVLFEKYLNQ